MPQVVTLGDINVDIIASIPRYPAPGGDGLAQRAEIHSGGSAANTATVLARFGLDVSIIGRVGRDAFAEQALACLAGAGVDLSCVQRDDDLITGLMFIPVTPDGERTLFGYRGANSRLDPALLDEGYIAKADVFHLSGYALLAEPQRSAVRQAVEMAHQVGVVISLDAGLEAAARATEEVKALLPLVDLIFPNRAEAEHLTGSSDVKGAARALSGYGVKTVALKLGGQGCVVHCSARSPDRRQVHCSARSPDRRREIFSVPAFAVEVQDTTGAGDSFDAGFILGQLWGLGARQSAILANALGALAASAVGAGDALPGPEKARALLQRCLSDPGWRDWEGEISRILKRLSAEGRGG
jgi:ribokinase